MIHQNKQTLKQQTMKTQEKNYTITKVKSMWILDYEGISDDCKKWYRKRDAVKFMSQKK